MCSQQVESSLPSLRSTGLLGLDASEPQRDSQLSSPVLLRPIDGWDPIGRSLQAPSTPPPPFACPPAPTSPSSLADSAPADPASASLPLPEPPANCSGTSEQTQTGNAWPCRMSKYAGNPSACVPPDWSCKHDGCGALCSDWMALQRHAFELQHSAFPCWLCAHPFVCVFNLHRHWEAQHATACPLPFPTAAICQECGAEESSLRTLTAHGAGAEHAPFKCFDGHCARVPARHKYRTSFGFRRHQITQHPELYRPSDH